MENAKDTFYVTLRNRLAALNPNRVIILRGVQRPGILMEEAEAPVAQLPADAFVLRWTALDVDVQLPSVLAQMTCEVHYTTGGTEANAGLDRGRTLEGMDAELLGILSPNCAPKMNFTQTPTATMATKVFWGEPQFSTLTTQRERLTRVVKINVFTFQERGEL
ncbi:hypothetical protein H7849_21500 [Alloacidobacterium dinghuense]|uniref:Uncharacterized protein n=1 Tax=Alloacidobacterium dinghuense TaxID=2763107 RepID=A0A7G8BGE2_9BACT|nr:hypothetical protein [Alloacidobacterium dinghuense]QNI31612.1 hypothetical protein H7849_21500 [Alloacidobacterium dinghuense]